MRLRSADRRIVRIAVRTLLGPILHRAARLANRMRSIPIVADRTGNARGSAAGCQNESSLASLRWWMPSARIPTKPSACAVVMATAIRQLPISDARRSHTTPSSLRHASCAPRGDKRMEIFRAAKRKPLRDVGAGCRFLTAMSSRPATYVRSDALRLIADFFPILQRAQLNARTRLSPNSFAEARRYFGSDQISSRADSCQHSLPGQRSFRCASAYVDANASRRG